MSSSDIANQDATAVQRAYYAATAEQYDRMHLGGHSEHDFALRFMISMIGYMGITSVLDVGSGTGRCLIQILEALPGITAVGIEPSAALREIGYHKGLTTSQLIDGDAFALAFPDNSFDLVCEFGVLHHLPAPSKAASEMLRVARKAIFISDSNNFGQGGGLSRFVKQALNAADNRQTRIAAAGVPH